MTGRFSQAEWDDYVSTLRTFLITGLPGVAIVIAWRASPPSAAQRRQITAMLDTIPPEQLALVRGHAFATDSALARGVLTAVNWVSKKPFPERVFSGPRDALRWMQQQMPTFDATSCWLRITSRVPPGLLWVEQETS